MFNKDQKKEQQKYSITIDKLLTELTTYDPDSLEFQHALEKLEKVERLRSAKQLTSRINPDTVLLCGTNLLGIGIMVGYESRHVITSVAQKFLIKPH